MKFIKEVTPKGLLLPVTATRLAGYEAGEKVEYHIQDGTVVVLKGRMTAMELLNAARSLHELSVELNSHLAKVCGQCDGCVENGGEDGCPLLAFEEADIALPDYLREEAGIPEGASSSQSPLSSVSACGENYARSLAPPLRGRPAPLGSAAIWGNGGCGYDLRDLPPETLAMFTAANVCLGELEERLIVGDIVYGG